MFDDINNLNKNDQNDDQFEILQELERNTPDEIRKQRDHYRIPIKAAVTLRPGNASQLLEFKARGVTGDISEGGLGTLFPIPANVGDIYRLEFDRSQLDLPMTFVRCVRCSFVREDAYNCGFRFFAPVPLPENLMAGKSEGSA